MTKFCPNCNREWPDENGFCSACGTPLVRKGESSGHFNLSLGDANAVSGGIHMADSHNVDSHDVYTTDSHNVHNETHNTWVTQQERQRTPEEIYAEKLKIFRKAVRDIFEDGRVTEEENYEINSKQYELGIKGSDARQIFEEERTLSFRRVKDRPLTDSEFSTLKYVQSCIRNNDKESLPELFDELRYLNARVDNGEVQYFYYLLYAVLKTDEFIDKAKDDVIGVDCFWKTVWLAMADRIKGIRRSMVLDIKFHQCMHNKDLVFPGNVEIAYCIDTLKEALTSKMKLKAESLFELARRKYLEFEKDHQSFLDDLGSAVRYVLERKSYPIESAFYLEYLFPEVANPVGEVTDPLSTPLTKIPQMPKIGMMNN